MLGPNPYQLDGLTADDRGIGIIHDGSGQALLMRGCRRNNFNNMFYVMTYTAAICQIKDRQPVQVPKNAK